MQLTFPKMIDLTRQLTSIVGPGYVIENPAARIDQRQPVVAVVPPDAEAIAQILRFANREGLTVVPCGAGTRLHIGNPPERVDILLSTARLNQVVEYEPADQTAVVGAGLSLYNFYRRTSENKQWLPLDSPSGGQSTLGGIVATNTYGPLRTHYGTARDYVIGAKIVLADGTMIKTGGRVVKNVAGYDMTKLFIGSFGTLGVITELVFKLRPMPEAETTCLLMCEALEPLAAVAIKMSKSELLPISVEIVDAKVLRQIALPPGTALWGLLARFGESQAGVDYQAERLAVLAGEQQKVSYLRLNEETGARVWPSLNEFESQFESELTLRITVPAARTAEAINQSIAQFRGCGPRYAIAAHAVNGIIRVYLKYVSESATAEDKIIKAVRELRSILVGHGFLTVERAPTPLKPELGVWNDALETATLMRGLKQKFDPKRILNPGRFVLEI